MERFYGLKWQRLLFVAMVIIMAAAAVFSFFALRSAPTPSRPAATAKPSIQRRPAGLLSSSYLVSGDVFWGRGIDLFAKESPLKYDWPFSRLKEFQPEQHNGWIADMECPVNRTQIPYQTQVDSLVFACSPDYLAAASKYFTAFTLANNHTDNTGASGFSETQMNLGNAGIQYFGHYDQSQTDDLCNVVTLGTDVDSRPAKLPIAMCGYHWLARLPTDAEISKITEYAKYFPVWVFPHGGTEYDTGYTPQQQTLYHKFIDAGASVVFGDHPHVVEPTEAYNGKLIIYDMGNLIFDQWFDSEVTRNMVVGIKVSAAVDDNLQKYLDMAASCSAYNDACLQTAQSENLHAYKLTYSYTITAGDSSRGSLDDRAKHLASPAVQQWLLERADWSKTAAGLSNQPY